MMATTRRNVVLHFDLNRTVLMSDAAGGRTMENTVDYLLSECSWGYVHPQQPSKVTNDNSFYGTKVAPLTHKLSLSLWAICIVGVRVGGIVHRAARGGRGVRCRGR
jgi:hypothetical protein